MATTTHDVGPGTTEMSSGSTGRRSLSRSPGLASRITSASARRPRRVLAAWFIGLMCAVALAATSLSGMTSNGYVVGATESSRALAIYNAVTGARDGLAPTDFIIVSHRTEVVSSTVFRSTVARLASFASSSRGVTGVTANVSPGSPLVASHGHAAIIAFHVASDPDVRPLEAQVQRLNGVDGFTVAVTGSHTLAYDLAVLSQSDLQRGELDFGLPIALIILILVFGAVVAGLIPVVMALVSIGVGMGLAALLAQQFTLSTFIVNMMTAMGLALGIDYSLFVISRFREERERGRSVVDAVEVAGSTAGRAVLFSGGTFAVALCGIFLVRDNVLRSLAAGAVIVSVVSVAAALTLLPAALSLVGDRVNALRLPGLRRRADLRRRDAWRVAVECVTRRPVIWLTATTVLLVGLAVPALGLHLGQSGVSDLPRSIPVQRGYVMMTTTFPQITSSPVKVSVVATPSTMSADIEKVRSAIAGEPLLGRPLTEVNVTHTAVAFSVPITGDPTSASTLRTVRSLRATLAHVLMGTGARAYVGGVTAQTVDFIDVVDAATPWVLLFVFSISFLLLLIAFRSLVVALLSIVLNMVAIGAAYGVLTMVFLKGFGASALGFSKVTAIDAWIPLFLFAVLFALSMDYHVLLMSRIKEHVVEGQSTRDAVINAVSSSARIIGGAALIIIVVFCGFARGQLVMFQQMGFGVAVALLLDATLVRLVMLPTALTVLDRGAWYLPKWLEWLPNVNPEVAS